MQYPRHSIQWVKQLINAAIINAVQTFRPFCWINPGHPAYPWKH